jgi:TPP-dependent 2-oxoacid decarboxylase
MADLQVLLTEIDELSPDELEQVYRHVVQRRHPVYWLIPGERLKEIQEIMQPVYKQTAGMSDEEIDAIIDESLRDVRRG